MLIEIERRDDISIVRLKGRFVMATDADYLRTQRDQIKLGDHTKLLVDLSEVPSICSTVIGFVVDLYTSITKKPDGRFILASANPRVQEVLTITRLSTVIPLAADTTSGLAALRNSRAAV
jgi:anti-anti-sigma factor